ncbi:cellulose biosynthesis protein BcsS, partial [Clostridium perfringens]
DAEASERAIALLDSAPSHRIAYELLGGAAPEQALLFAGFDIWRHGFSAYGGIQWTPDRFKTSGMFVRMTASETVAKFNDSNGQFTTQI